MENNYQINGIQIFRFQQFMLNFVAEKLPKMVHYENDFQGILLPTFQLREQRMKIAQCSECVSEEKRQIWIPQKKSWIKPNGVTKLIE